MLLLAVALIVAPAVTAARMMPQQAAPPLYTVAASGGAAGGGLMRGSDSVLSVVVSSPTPNTGSHWLGMFLQGANVSAIERYRNFCPPGGCSPTTPPSTIKMILSSLTSVVIV